MKVAEEIFGRNNKDGVLEGEEHVMNVLGRICVELTNDLDTRRTKEGTRLKGPAKILLDAIKQRPDPVSMHDSRSGVSKRLTQLDAQYQGIKDCYVLSKNTIAFFIDRFRERAPQW